MIRPILFSGDMVRAILDGRKTQTRRPVKPQPPYHLDICRPSDNIRLHGCGRGRFHWTNGMQWEFWPGGLHGENDDMIPPHSCGDLLWLRETWAQHPCAKGQVFAPGDGHPWGSPIYRATFGAALKPTCEGFSPWRPSIHMPRWACRIILKIEDVRVQRVQEISERDANAEGIEEVDGMFDAAKLCAMAKHIGCPVEDARPTFATLWDSIYARRGLGWEANPWVWALTFSVAARTNQEAQKLLAMGGGA